MRLIGIEIDRRLDPGRFWILFSLNVLLILFLVRCNLSYVCALRDEIAEPNKSADLSPSRAESP